MSKIEFPRMATISQAAAESGIPAYRIRQLCKAGTVRSVQCGRKTLINLSSLAAWRTAASRHSSPVSAGLAYENKKATQRVTARQTAKEQRKNTILSSAPILSNRREFFKYDYH